VAEIKSTLELAMERTKHFTFSEKEKEEMKQKEVLQKATSLFYRYREGHLSSKEVLKEIEKLEEDARSTVKRLLLSQCIDALSLDDEEGRIFEVVESLKERSLPEIRQRFSQVLSQYKTDKEKMREKTRIQRMEAFKKEGIYGSAVEPKVEGSELWKEETGRLNQVYGTRLEEIKQQLHSL